jgi:GDP-L-fucose synthase
MIKKAKIYVAGHSGMVGSGIVRELKNQGYINILTQRRSDLDLTNQAQVQEFFRTERPDEVYLCAAKVGGIHANDTFPAEFIYENLMVEANVVHNAWKSGVKKLLFLGSSCIYPKLAAQPMIEESLLTGPLEPTNEPYAVAKIAGIKLCESYNRQYGKTHGIDYRSVMPSNIYGPGDNYHSENSHVIPALIRRFHEAKLENLPGVSIWGSGSARREFLFVDDMVAASIHIMNLGLGEYETSADKMQSHINIGCGQDISIRELAYTIARVVAYRGKVSFDLTRPDGPPRKLLDCTRIEALGWRFTTGLEEGLTYAYQDFLENSSLLRMN